jgi:hypothetical protein
MTRHTKELKWAFRNPCVHPKTPSLSRLEVSMDQQGSPGWLATILLIVFVPISINYFTGLTTPFIRLQLTKIAIWPSKRQLRILEEALSQARGFSQNAAALYQDCLKEAFISIVFLSLSLVMLCFFLSNYLLNYL